MAKKTDPSLLPTDLFQAGGTLSATSRSYVKRKADDLLFKEAKSGQFCYVLTTRQMGKSSLVVRTEERLKREGIRTANIDLTTIGTDATVEQWYLGLLTYIVNQLDININIKNWWEQNHILSPVQRFSNFLRDVVLKKIPEQVVIFIDEIDTTLKLGYSDDFFAGIRAMYNARATDPAYKRLTFILLGVATPTDLMQDRQRTPFNVGKQIDLPPFQSTDKINLENLRAGLETIYPREGDAIFKRIFHWTSGHPYLTQKLCLELAKRHESKVDKWSHQEIDRVVEKVLLSDEGQSNDTNIQFVSARILTHDDRADLLKLYQKVYQENHIPYDKRSLLQGQLIISGLVRAENGRLLVNNQIYHEVFDQNWIAQNTSKEISRKTVIATALAAIALIVIISIFNFVGRPTTVTPSPDTISNIDGTVTREVELAATAAMLETSAASAMETAVIAAAQTSTTIADIDAAAQIATETAVAEISATETAVIAAAQTATSIAETATANAPTETAVIPTLEPLTARANQSAGIFSSPSSNFEELSVVGSGDSVEVLNRAEADGWMFVQDSEGVEGFAATALFNFSEDEFAMLPPKFTPNVALVINSVSILSEPVFSLDNQLAFASPGEFLEVLGRSENGILLYVKNTSDVKGFVFIKDANQVPLLDWPGSPEELNNLLVP